MTGMSSDTTADRNGNLHAGSGRGGGRFRSKPATPQSDALTDESTIRARTAWNPYPVTVDEIRAACGWIHPGDEARVFPENRNQATFLSIEEVTVPAGGVHGTLAWRVRLEHRYLHGPMEERVFDDREEAFRLMAATASTWRGPDQVHAMPADDPAGA